MSDTELAAGEVTKLPQPATGAICPGAKTLLPADGEHYLRLSFLVYWKHMPPGKLMLYCTKHEIEFSLDGFEALEAEALALVQKNESTDATDVAFYSYTGIALTEDEVTSLGWLVLAQDTAPAAVTLPGADVPAVDPTDT